MNQARRNHSSCSLGDYIYVCCGEDNNDSFNSFERLNVVSFLGGTQDTSWEPLQIEENELLTPRSNCSMAAFGSNKIIVFGGDNAQLGGLQAEGCIVEFTKYNRRVSKRFDAREFRHT